MVIFLAIFTSFKLFIYFYYFIFFSLSVLLFLFILYFFNFFRGTWGEIFRISFFPKDEINYFTVVFILDKMSSPSRVAALETLNKNEFTNKLISLRNFFFFDYFTLFVGFPFLYTFTHSNYTEFTIFPFCSLSSKNIQDFFI